MDLEKRINDLEKRVEKLEKKKKPVKGESDGSKVWTAYSGAIYSKYGHNPVRNAKVNSNCSDLAKRLGLSEALEVVKFYVTQNDSFYVKNMHPISLCLSNCEGLYLAWKRGGVINRDKANKIERRSNSVNATQSYLERKHNEKK